MRVIAGQHKGRPLRAPKGDATRPTTDRVREALFSSLASACGGLQDAVVLDAFAGSGALGVEAASRGAAHVTLCERNRAALAAIRDNTSFLDPATVRVVAGDVLARVPMPPVGTTFDLVLLDPPYDLEAGRVRKLLDDLELAGALSPDALVSYEHARDACLDAFDQDPPLQYACSFQELSCKAYATSAISLYRKAAL